MEPNISDEVSVSDLFERFIEATTMKNVITIHNKILDYADLKPCEFNTFFSRYKRAVTSNRQKKNWKAKALFSKIEKRANHKCYSNTKAPPAPMSNKTSDTNVQAESSNSNNHTNMLDDSLSSSQNNTGNQRVFSNNNALQHYKCLIIGSGPAGLRTAIELQLLGAERVVIVEKRSRFSRNNVLHLWPFVIDDLKSLGAKKFYGKFCAGSIDHISIRQLQLILLKVCLMIGCDFRDSCSYISLCPSSIKHPMKKRTPPTDTPQCDTTTTTTGASDEQTVTCNYSKCNASATSEPEAKEDHQEVQVQASDGDEVLNSSSEMKENSQPQKRSGQLKGALAHFESDHAHTEEELQANPWDIIIGADGRRNTLKNFFPRKEFRGRLAIAITANFINRQTPAETSVPEISGLSFIYNQDMFNALAYDTGIQLENICYYKDDTHYFVMTAKKKSLLERGVLIRDYATTQDLLSESNVNKDALLKYAKDAAFWTTGLEPLDFALNHYGQEDCAMFDFTSMYAASNACKALRTKEDGLTLVSLVGDSLLEPFWPTGSGCARGFLSSFDAAWMCRQWAVNKCAVLDHHGSVASRSSRNRNNLTSGQPTKLGTKALATYDKMALSVIAERESIYRILAQTTSENLQQNYAHWTLNPHTRYPNLNRHLILPSQVEHLIADPSSKPLNVDGNLLSPNSEASATTKGRRIKSPNQSQPRRSPKKLKSAGASPSSQPRNAKNRAKSMPKSNQQKSKSRHDISSHDDYYLELEESYRNLADGETGGMTQYLNYGRRRTSSSDLDDLFIPSISGTLPSSHNLSKLEARRARDIDECLRQRRQKTKITLVRDQLISQMRGDDKRDKDGTPLFAGGNAALFNEIKRMREQQSRGARAIDGRSRDAASGPLSLLNSMRRCASFAERVKSFESKLSNPADSSESTVSTPRTPIDNVKNLPQFATLQELFVNSSQKSEDQTGKSRIPIAKLTKDDWNVKCWEERLGGGGIKHRQLSNSTRSLNKALSVDTGREQVNRSTKPKKQVDVFQDRINQMANKLKTVTDKQSSHQTPLFARRGSAATTTSVTQTNENKPPGSAPIRSQGWVSHLKRELAKGSESGRRYQNSIDRPAMNPGVPNKPIKKLFQDDDEQDDDGIDVNKHYDHLCVNRPTNKYLTKGGYKSHLARTNVTAKVINRPEPTAESKRAYMAALTSRGSSASSTLSDYSTNTGHSSSGSGGKQPTGTTISSSIAKTTVLDVECFRCRKFVSKADRITIGNSLLHRICLTCANCGITLRSNELQHYMALVSGIRAKNSAHLPPPDQETQFVCAICKPDIREDLDREAGDRLAEVNHATKDQHELGSSKPQRMQSREEFLNSRINYGELYKNIMHDRSNELTLAQRKIDREVGNVNRVSARADDDDKSQLRPDRPAKVTPSPVQVTLPMKLVRDRTASSCSEQAIDDGGRKFSIASSETGLDGSEQVTLILPSESAAATPSNGDPDETLCGHVSTTSSHRRSGGVESRKEMIDEEELQRILHLDNRKSSDRSKSSSSEEEAPSREDEGAESSSSDDNRKRAADVASSQKRNSAGTGSRSNGGQDDESSSTSDNESSSLDLPPDSDEFYDNGEEEDDDDENVDLNSTCDDFITTEEFDAASDKEAEEEENEHESTLSEVSNGRNATTTNGGRRNESASLSSTT